VGREHLEMKDLEQAGGHQGKDCTTSQLYPLAETVGVGDE
jgi:hypothetical protein